MAVIHHFIGHAGFPPTLAEIAEDLGCTVSTAQGHVDRLIRKGALDRGEGEQRRTLRITDDEFLKENGPASLSGISDDEMVAELERRGYKVSVRRVRGRR